MEGRGNRLGESFFFTSGLGLLPATPARGAQASPQSSRGAVADLHQWTWDMFSALGASDLSRWARMGLSPATFTSCNPRQVRVCLASGE